jgi:hypothetical protein
MHIQIFLDKGRPVFCYHLGGIILNEIKSFQLGFYIGGGHIYIIQILPEVHAILNTTYCTVYLYSAKVQHDILQGSLFKKKRNVK